MIRPDRQKAVLDILKDFSGLDPLKQLFWSELSYQRVNQPLARQAWTETASNALAEDPVLFAGGGQDNAFHVIYARLASDRLLIGQERPVISRLLRDHPYALFVFSNNTQDRWHFINVKYDEKGEKRRLFRRITIGPEERLRTASERLALLDLASVSPDLFGLSPLAVQTRHDEAFDVEAVTKQFFEEYKAIFGILEDELRRQTKAREWAHDYALQFLNRCMFLYFVQRKRWLGSDTEFLRTFWEAYRDSGQPKDSFFELWLKVLFFEAFNNKFHGGHRHFPNQIKEALAVAPFLNGGLFKENDLDRKYDFKVPDNRFVQVFTFLERYNFTITEDSPLDQEVAVDPEMIGKVYESLVNVSTEADERGDAGIFYTPRTEIDLMCRLALVDNLANHLGEDRKKHFYEAVFAFEPEEKAAADKALAEAKLWPALADYLREITVLDPACGSGSFLVGMLHILDDLQARASAQLGIEETPYDRRKRIIGQSLYGVDVMDWAVHVAELRLWLALIVDAEFTQSQLHIQQEPLLPHFTFKVRCGDSLVQEVGGINLGHIRGSHQISPALKGRITALKAEKLKFYNNDPECRYRSAEQLVAEERRLFRDLLQERHTRLQEEIKSLRRKLEGPKERQVRLDGTEEPSSHQMKLEAAQWQKEVESLNAELERVARAREALKKDIPIPFVWDISFVEVFEGEKAGFDIVIGNPPYVRTQSIADPRFDRDGATPDNRREYKTKLARSVYQAFRRFFNYIPRLDSVGRKLDARSDLYVYFYFHGLALLNSQGSFCFITSNSWLDVAYGADLQEFLLRHCHMKMILDNRARRSFSTADINTVICLFSAPDEQSQWGVGRISRFVTLKVPFENVLSPVIFEELEAARSRVTTPEYRVYPVMQKELLAAGAESIVTEGSDEDVQSGKRKAVTGPLVRVARYIGSKWGGTYLRAPDIYYTVLEKLRGKAVLLKSLCDVNEGRPTGANDFFYPEIEVAKEFGIEDQYLFPGLMKARGANFFVLRRKNLDRFFLAVSEPKSALKHTNVLRYIAHGEAQGLHRRNTFRRKPIWYVFSVRPPADLVLPCGLGTTFFCAINSAKAVASNSFTELRVFETQRDTLPIWAWMNSAAAWLYSELMGRSTLGGGLLKVDPIDYRRMPVLPARLLPQDFPVLDREVGTIHEEAHCEDRRALDGIIFESLGLSRGESESLYEAVINLVDTRLTKAASLAPQKIRSRVEAAHATRGIWAQLPDEDEEELGD